MPGTWFTADLHLGRANIIRFCSRPFATVGEMDQAILERLNSSVRVNDNLYFPGDFCMGSHKRVVEYRRSIRCKKIFVVPGNHDKQVRKLKEDFL
jgi:calcineurin-like phosphoesterase family protein